MDRLKEGSRVTRNAWSEGIYFIMVSGKVMAFQPRLCTYVYNEDIMVSEGWILDDGDKEYVFSDIIEPLRRGAKARLNSWSYAFIYLDASSKEIVIQTTEPLNFTPDFESFLANDWIEIE